MTQATITFQGLDEQVKRMIEMPGVFKRARVSALKSLGWYVRQALANQIEYGGEGWRPLRSLTVRLKKSNKDKTPLFWLGRFARYRAGKDDDFLQVGFGKSKAAADAAQGLPQEGSFDPQLDAMVRRHEYGATEKVGAKATPHLAAMFWGKGRSQKRTRTVILKKSTTQVVLPARPMVRPVMSKIEPVAMPIFKDKFLAALVRYETGAKWSS